MTLEEAVEKLNSSWKILLEELYVAFKLEKVSDWLCQNRKN